MKGIFKVKSLNPSSYLPPIVVDTHKRPFGLSHIAVAIILALSVSFPISSAHAGMLSDFTTKVKAVFLGQQALAADDSDTGASQTMDVFKPIVVDATGTDQDLDDSGLSDALSATTGSLRVSTENVDLSSNDSISLYEVKKGDSLATVAKLFGVSKNTIIWANNLKSEKITPGDMLLILPVTGVKVTVKKGDTLATIAKKYKGDVNDIAQYNGIAPDADLAVGDVVIVPDGEVDIVAPPAKKKSYSGSSGGIASGVVSTYERLLDTYSYVTPPGFLIRPIIGGRKTQGLHGHNGVDLANNVGTPVMASADGTVIAAKSSGYNGGYGEMIIIAHANNIQTVYGHLSQVNVSVGQTVSQGQVIGAVGNTGRSTGPHLHFEVRGAKNPF